MSKINSEILGNSATEEVIGSMKNSTDRLRLNRKEKTIHLFGFKGRKSVNFSTYVKDLEVMLDPYYYVDYSKEVIGIKEHLAEGEHPVDESAPFRDELSLKSFWLQPLRGSGRVFGVRIKSINQAFIDSGEGQKMILHRLKAWFTEHPENNSPVLIVQLLPHA